MFGFGKKKETTTSSAVKQQRVRRSEEFEERKAQSRAQLGFLVGLDDTAATSTTGGSGLPSGGSFDVDDAELENELLMLLGDDSPAAKTKQGRPPPPKSGGKTRPKAPVAQGLENLDFNINLEDEGAGDGDDDDLLDDPDLHAELGEILGEPAVPREPTPESEDESSKTPPTMSSQELVKVLQDRLQLYEQAKTAADKSNDTAKSRRFTRGIKTLKELLSKAKSGRVVDEADIPPVVSLGAASVAKPLDPSPDSVFAPESKFTPISPPEPKKKLSPNDDLSTTSDRDFLTPSPQPCLPEPIKPLPVIPPRKSRPLPEPPVDYDGGNSAKLFSVSTPAPPEPPTDYDSTQPQFPSFSQPIPEEVASLLKDYKKMAVLLKRNNDTIGAVNYLKLSKTLESLIASGQPISLSQFPSVEWPQQEPFHMKEAAHEEAPPSLNSADVPPPPTEQHEDIFGAPPPPKTIIEALEQRLEKYKSEVDKANEVSNSSKARRMGRIVKQYEEAISLYKKGKPVPFEDLPSPPGFAPIPTGGGGGNSAHAGPLPTVHPEDTRMQTVRPAGPSFGESSPEKKPKPSPIADSSNSPSGSSTTPTSSISRPGGKPVTKLTLQEKQLALIQLRQKQYRESALEAKKRGDINQAREYLRISKGFDNLIEASRSGLPVDLTTLPSAPDALASLEAEDFEIISDQDCIVPTGNLAEIYSKLEEDLKQQLKMCMRTRDHFKNIGDVASANRFEGMALDTKKDLDALRLAAKTSQKGVPKYHYENRIFSITECNTDIKEDEIEITVLRGINYKGANTIDTFVRVELPYPTVEEAQSQKSHVVKDSTDPEYNVTYKMNVNRTARNFQRFVHRHGVKIEVFSKGGFLRSSTLFGTATAKLQPLETKCTLHDAFDILDGRKVVGKVEVKIRLRDPVLTKQITQKKEKWLSIDRA